MSRQATLLSVLGAVLLLVVGYLFVVKPKQDEIADIRTEIQSTQDQQRQVEAQIARLEQVRATIPEVEAAIAAADTIVPHDDAKLSAAVRQLQVAANDSGTELTTVSLARPAAVTDTETTVPADLASINVSVTITGGYYQIVDFLRRIEDPVISPRAILWNTSSVALEEYPTLTATLTGSMYAYLEDLGDEPEAPAPTDGGEQATDAPTDGETDVDVDVNVDVNETEGAA